MTDEPHFCICHCLDMHRWQETSPYGKRAKAGRAETGQASLLGTEPRPQPYRRENSSMAWMRLSIWMTAAAMHSSASGISWSRACATAQRRLRADEQRRCCLIGLLNHS
jgi:hypothetical protein